MQKRPRIWLGGMGEKRLLRMTAKYADGWNVPFIGPELFQQKNAVLTQWCEKERRAPQDITRTINLGLALGRTEADATRKRQGLQAQFGAALSFLEPGMLIGTPQQVIDRIGEYVTGGAEWIIVALRAPFDVEGLRVFIDEVMPAFR
jgi:alkanesulfonate monooxygenase SsuD/methylene tetrahydromethanopterin reductase-like flavin-dependent oxidoreductase (luciferase family)